MKRLLVLAALLAAPGSAAAEPLVERAKLEIQPAERAITKVAISNPLGNVRVEGYDGTSIQIETIKRAPTEEALDRLRVSLVPNPDGTVRITTTADGGREVQPVARDQVRIDLLVRAPRDARVEAVSSAGSLEVVNMDAGGMLDTSSGRISVKNVSGEVSTSTLSGATRLEQVFGSVDAQTLASDVELDSITGQRLVASVNRGSIAGRRVRSREVELTTTDGGITLEAEAGLRGRVMVASLRGDIDVKLRRSTATTIRARGAKVTFGGAARSAGTDGWVTATFGTATGKEVPAFVEMRSRHGNVQLHLIESK